MSLRTVSEYTELGYDYILVRGTVHKEEAAFEAGDLLDTTFPDGWIATSGRDGVGPWVEFSADTSGKEAA